MTCTATRRFTDPVRTVTCELPVEHTDTDPALYVAHVAHVQDGIVTNTYLWTTTRKADR